jgi:hypothetical protein
MVTVSETVAVVNAVAVTVKKAVVVGANVVIVSGTVLFSPKRCVQYGTPQPVRNEES